MPELSNSEMRILAREILLRKLKDGEYEMLSPDELHTVHEALRILSETYS